MIMGYSVRTFLIADDDTVWRLASNKFWQMLHNPASHCLPAFAGRPDTNCRCDRRTEE